MSAEWSPRELERIGVSGELEIATVQNDGTLRRWVPTGWSATKPRRRRFDSLRRGAKQRE